jgi:hypothetical protein
MQAGQSYTKMQKEIDKAKKNAEEKFRQLAINFSQP